MKRQLFCYLTWILELILLIILFLIIYYSYNNGWRLGPYAAYIPIIIFLFIIMIIPLIYSILFFGTPKNNIKKYKIMNPKIQLIKNDLILIYYNEDKCLYECNYYGKILEFDVKGWINPKQRITDIIYIQLHNYYFNSKKITNGHYLKKIIDNKSHINFQKRDKIKSKKLKPSLILKMKMILAISQFKNSKVPQDKHWKRNLYDTFLIVE